MEKLDKILEEENEENDIYVLLNENDEIVFISNTPIKNGIKCNCSDPYDKVFNNGCSYFYDKRSNCILWSDELHEIQELNRKSEIEKLDEEWEFQQSLRERLETLEQNVETVQVEMFKSRNK